MTSWDVLDLDANPAAGDPAKIDELARHWQSQGTSADAAATTLDSAKNNITTGTLHLKGDFAAKIHDAIGGLPGELRKLSRGYGGCGKALTTYSTSLTAAQAKASTALSDGGLAAADIRRARQDLEALLPDWQADVDQYGGSFGDTILSSMGDQSDEVKAALQRKKDADHRLSVAKSLALQAQSLKTDAENTCAKDIGDALEGSGLKNKSWWQKVGDYLKNAFTTWDGFVKLCETISTVLGVIAIFLSGPLALVVGAILLGLAAIQMADTIRKFAKGEIGWKELAMAGAMLLLQKVGGKLLGKALKRLSNTKFVTGVAEKLHGKVEAFAEKHKWGETGRSLAHRTACAVTGHPVDISTGKVFTDFVDLRLPGPLPFVLERVWYSTSTYHGPFGHGWHHSYDDAVQVTADALIYHTPDGRLLDLLPLEPGESYYERVARLSIERQDDGYRLTGADGITRRYAPVLGAISQDDVVACRLRDVTNRSGNRITLLYDEQGRLAELTDSAGRSVTFELDGEGRVTSLSVPHPDDANARLVAARYEYDDAGNLVRVVDSLEQAYVNEYDGHLLIAETNRTGLTFRFGYDGADERARCIRTWGDGGLLERNLSYEFGATVVVDSLGHSTRHEHEGGLVVRMVDPEGGVTRTDYDYQQPVRRVDPLERATGWEYDCRGNIITLTRPDGSTVESRYDALDNPVEVSLPDGTRLEADYDDQGLLLAERDQLGAATRYGYDERGLLTKVTDALGGSQQIENDPAGSPVAVIDPLGARTEVERDALGRPVAVIDPLGATTRLTWSTEDALLERMHADGTRESWQPDAEGHPAQYVDAAGLITRYERGWVGRLLGVTGPDGAHTCYRYDSEAQLREVTNPQGLTWRYDVDWLGRVVRETDFNARVLGYQYDRAGQLVHSTNGLGERTDYRYDALGNVVQLVVPAGTTRFEWDPVGRLTRAVNGDVNLVLERDRAGRIVAEVSNGRLISSTFDALGRRRERLTPSGARSSWTWDAAGALRAVELGAHRIAFARDLAGREVERRWGDAVVTQNWDSVGRLRAMVLTGPTGTVQQRDYAYSPDGYLTRVNDLLAGNRSYALDSARRVTAVTGGGGGDERYAYDIAGNITSTAGAALADSSGVGPREYQGTRAREVGNLRYRYDRQGRLLTRTQRRLSSPNRTWHYTWDAHDRMIEARTPEGILWQYLYDALGRRTAKLRLGDDGVTVVERIDFTWDGTQLAEQELALPGQASADRITWDWEPGSYRPLGQRTSSGGDQEWFDERFHAIVTDLVGTPTELVDDEGFVGWRPRHTLWGAGSSAEVGAVTCPLRFPGQYADPETGTNYNFHRHYDPDSGQFTSSDPLGLAGGPQPSSYVSNPLVVADCLGLKSTSKYSGESDGHMDPQGIRFSQDSVTFRFSDKPIDSLTKALKNGSIDLKSFPPIRLVRKDGLLFSLDNRRLAAFKDAGVNVPYRMATPEEEANEDWKFTTKDNGVNLQYALWGPSKFRKR